MRNKIFGAIGVIWGALILLNWFSNSSSASGSYASGMNMAAILGVLMFVIGIYTFFKKPKTKD